MASIIEPISTQVPIVDPETGRPTPYFQRILQKLALGDSLQVNPDGSLTLADMATQRVLGRNTAGTGAPEEVTIHQFLDWLGGVAQGDIIYRDAAGVWNNLAPGTIGNNLVTLGAGANPRWIGFVGCMAIKSADEAAANYSALTAIPWTSEKYDTNGFHDNVTNNTRLTVPDLSGTYGMKAKKVSLRGHAAINSVTANEPITLSLTKNGAADHGLPFIMHGANGTTPSIELVAHNIPVTGDGSEYFELSLDAGADTSITIAANRSCFQIWVTEWQA